MAGSPIGSPIQTPLVRRSTQPRDVQRSRVYRSEVGIRSAAGERLLWGEKADKVLDSSWNTPRYYPSVAAVQAYTDWVLSLAPVQRRWGKIHITARSSGHSADVWRRAINLGLGYRNETSALHEIAHVLAYISSPDAQWHGPEFAGVLAFLYKTVAGEEKAKEFKTRLRSNRAKINTKGVPAPTHAVVTQTERKAKEVALKRHQRAEETRRAVAQRANASKPLSHPERAQAAALIRRAVKAGTFGPSGSKPRAHALATARAIESS
jgi:putative metallohydrolase (TIGR04338 family)